LKKILFVLGLQNPFSGAAYTRVGFFAENFARRGCKSSILGTFDPKSFIRPSIKQQGKVTLLNLVPNIGLDHPVFFATNILFSFLWSTFFLALKKPDAVMVSFPTGDVGLGALMTCRLLGVKSVVDYRDEWEDYLVSCHPKSTKSFYRFIKKVALTLYCRSSLVLCVTPKYIQSLRQRGITEAKLVPNGADTKTFKPSVAKEKSDYFTIFYSGIIGEYYRLDVAVKALKLLRNKGISNIKLVCAGSGEFKQILDLAVELGVGGSVDYRGSVGHKQLVSLINDSDVGLIPYDANVLWKNSLPAKFFEYCACGVPVVATAYRDSLLANYIIENEVGFVSPPLDEEKLAEAFELFYRNNSLKVESGKRARVFVEENFDRNIIFERLFALLRKL
jgi:glycosyltransferase involved in cell wall biosynthesis